MQQVTQGNQQLNKAEKTHQELFSKQKNDEAQIADIQQKLEQASKNLQQERNEYQSMISEKDELFIKTAYKNKQ